MKNVVATIVTFNGHRNTNTCLDSLETMDLKDISLTVIVVDNASTEFFISEKKKYKNFLLEIIRNEENVGFSGGHNTALRSMKAKGNDYFIILNNDTILDKKLFQSIVKAAEQNQNVGIVAPKIYFAKGSEFHKDRYTDKEKGKVIWYAGGIIDWDNAYESHRGVDEVDQGQYDKTEETDFATGCCMLIKKTVLEKIGLFDERYFLYKEDVDFCLRTNKAGYTILYHPEGYLWHKNAESTGGSGSALQDYYTTRNRLLFGFTYAPIRTKIALFRESLRLLKDGREWQKKGVRDFYLGKLGKGSYN